jgi:hypothetical protein
MPLPVFVLVPEFVLVLVPEFVLVLVPVCAPVPFDIDPVFVPFDVGCEPLDFVPVDPSCVVPPAPSVELIASVPPHATPRRPTAPKRP